MNKEDRINMRVSRFMKSWKKLNQNRTHYECMMRGIKFIGFDDPRVQMYWKSLKTYERQEAILRLGFQTEKEVKEFYR